MEIMSIAGVVRVGSRQHAKRAKKKKHHVKPEERWWVAHRQQRQRQRRERERARALERECQRRRGLDTYACAPAFTLTHMNMQQKSRAGMGRWSLDSSSTPTDRDRDRGPSRLDLRESMKPRARFIGSARSDYREDERGRIHGENGFGDVHDDNNDSRRDYDDVDDIDDVVIINDNAGGCERGEYRDRHDYRRAYAYGIGTVLAGLVVAVVVMGSARWWMGGWDEGIESGRSCFAT